MKHHRIEAPMASTVVEVAVAPGQAVVFYDLTDERVLGGAPARD